MKKYEEEHYRYEKIKDRIYPWIKKEIKDSRVLNGKNIVKNAAAIAFTGDLKIVFAIRRGEDSYEIVTDPMLSPDIDIEEMYHTACENLVRDVEFVFGNTWDGAYSIIADGIHEASAVCFKHIWQVCVNKLKDDLVIMVPCKDTVLFAPAGQKKVVEGMLLHGRQAYENGADRITDTVFLFSREREELTVYEA